MAADEEAELFLSAYLVNEGEDDGAAALQAARAEWRAAGDWDLQRSLEGSLRRSSGRSAGNIMNNG